MDDETTADIDSPGPSRSITRRDALRNMASGTVASVGMACSSDAANAGSGTAKSGQVLGRRQTGPSVYKQRAISDFQANMAPFGGRMSAPSQRLLHQVPRQVPWQFDVLVIGSGYGASITACRLAQRMKSGHRLGILERGQEWVPGTFPDNLPNVLDASRLELLGPNKGQVHNPGGLFNVEQFDEITVLSGSGLGGSSLINASVAIRPDREVFYQPVWPAALRDRGYLDPYYELAEYELGAAREPTDQTLKMRAQRRAGEYLTRYGGRYEAARITVTRNCTGGAQHAASQLPILNRQGVRQRACIDCGDCLTGCNVGAKNTLAVNYLPMARSAGAEIFPLTQVNRVEKCEWGYRVHYTHFLPDGSGGYHACPGSTTTRLLFLGAGSLGTTEILLRSQRDNFRFSPRLGCAWTGNGDALGFITDTRDTTGIGGYSAYPTDRARVGPTIQTNLTYPFRQRLNQRVLIQEGAAARAYANTLGGLMLDLNLDHTQILLGMGHDGADGRIVLDHNGRARVTWPGLLDGEYRQLIRNEFRRVAEAMGGRYRFLRIFGDRMISVHPLGGCGMSDDPMYGVVNDRGQVFDAMYDGDQDPQTGQPRVHSGLYAMDGAILPTSIACNPFLTISALAERAADLVISDPNNADLFQPIQAMES